MSVDDAKNMQNMQTVLPQHIQLYLSQLAIVHYGSLHIMYEDMVSKFIMMRPWAANPPLPWRAAPGRAQAGCAVANVTLLPVTADRINTELEEVNKRQYDGEHQRYGITAKTFLYTAIMWWVMYVYPPPKSPK